MTVQERNTRDQEFDVAWFRKDNEKECELLSDEQIEHIIALIKALSTNIVARHTSHIPQE